jgi:hypothetical protein
MRKFFIATSSKSIRKSKPSSKSTIKKYIGGKKTRRRRQRR